LTFQEENIMGRERREAALASEARAYGYEKGTASESKGERRTMGATAVMPPGVAQEQKSTLKTEEETIEDIEVLYPSDVSELMEMMGPDSSLDSISYRSEEGEDSEDVRALTTNPKRIVRKAKKLVSTSTTASIGKDMEGGTQPMRTWLLSACRSCGRMIRFRSDEPQPPTCGRPQCIERFEERSKAGM
jgi:hypothetical protein